MKALDLSTAARLVEQHVSDIRAGDALHLAPASRHGASLATLERRLAGTATALDLSAVLR